MRYLSLLLLLFLTFTSACTQNNKVHFLALGDSYTIGESVEESMRWPNILAHTLGKINFAFEKPTIVAKTGWTTSELANTLLEENISSNYDVVSLLIGVNNQYRGYPIEQYKREFTSLLEQAIIYAGGKSEKVFVVSIPNYGVTPFGIKKGEDKIRQELLTYDAIADSIAATFSIPFVNITPISENAKQDPSLIASDQLHPSAKQYQQWVELITPVVENILRNNQ